MLKDMDFCHFYRLLDKGLDAFKKTVHKAGEFLGNNIADAITKSGIDNIKNKNLLKQ